VTSLNSTPETEVVVTTKQLMPVFLSVALTAYAHGDTQVSPDRPGRLFRQVNVDDAATVDAKQALVMGTYVLDSKATKRFLRVDTLMKAINKIRLTDWNVGVWTRENAELTVRQRMDDYIQTAHAFYTGEGKRPKGVVGRRLEKYTDIELGDRRLASALTTVRMATAWDVLLEKGQAERLDAVVRLRLAMISPQADDDVTKP
uniref:hypothetical protein n=1 Tax=Stieleria mannarensis TaxID=2755585 RepID=UPI001C71EFC6